MNVAQLAAALADTLDELAAGFLLIDSNARILHANVAGQAMLADSYFLQTSGGRLCGGALALALRDVLTAAKAGKASGASKSAAIKAFAGDDQRFVATVIPLTFGARRNGGVSYSAAAAVFVRKAEADLSMPVDIVSNLYDLTPAETRILLAIIKGGGVPHVASMLRISKTTVKSHLQRVFTKTGTSRQADLVKLVASFMAPRLASRECEAPARRRNRRRA
jgi:DNA-binding NarL/FixJ family response regulator